MQTIIASKAIRDYPDEIMYEMILPYQRTKAQAKFRNELFELTFQEYYMIWKDKWHNKGKQPDQFCLTRIDDGSAWNITNCYIIERSKQLARNGSKRRVKETV